MNLVTFPKSRLRGKISVPGDKSISHRAVMLASLAEGRSRIKNFSDGNDCLRTVQCFQKMGVEIQGAGGKTLAVEGRGLGSLREAGDVLDAGNSGTTLRLLLGVLSAQGYYSVITGDSSLRSRPMKRVVEPLSLMGASIWGREEGEYAPVSVRGNPDLKPITYALPVPSAQVKSALLLAGLFAEGKTSVKEDMKSRDHTERLLTLMGADIHVNETDISISGRKSLLSFDLTIPGDLSAASFFIAATLMCKNSHLIIENVGINSTRTGFLDVLQLMGADIHLLNIRESGNEPVADLEIRSSDLKGIVVPENLMPSCVDEVPILAVLATQTFGETVIRGAEELRVKESDRIHTMVSELRRMGGNIEELPDGMVITGKKNLRGATVDSHKDHRVAMALSIAGFVAQGRTEVENADCIATSFPGFMEIIRKF